MTIRLLDILLAGFAVVVLMPLFIVVSIFLRFTGEGEVLFAQKRAGLNGTPFKLWKFATMLKDSPNIGSGVLTTKNDPRVLPFGKLLRKLKINELPQLFNILGGSMSLIGPRPLAMLHYEALPDINKRVLTRTKPGLSGIGSIVFRNEEEVIEVASNRKEFHAEVIAPYKGQLDSWYANRMTVLLYLSLIGFTVWVVLSPNSRAYFRLLPSLPQPPSELSDL